MKLSEYVQEIVKDILIIFALIVIMITILRQIYYPDLAFDLKTIYIFLAFAFLSGLTELILYAPKEISEKKMRMKLFIHFLTLEILLISLSSILGIVNSVQGVIILAVQIAIIYILVRVLSWQKDKKDAQKINEKLKALKSDD
ncbi:DUF3021 family protein [Robertmurraya andreesenii]|uniref:Cell division protein FtsB n=1 Tax=Anoxybacillus andreesenii TaxID=1325932 RepID=A0ABT9V0I5_9BACL|nr:DUF3021 family protein [Robertmurraya andreesenii]MDQ0154428.1 cell division protein FtsB [Robertmurraya andreesenii]